MRVSVSWMPGSRPSSSQLCATLRSSMRSAPRMSTEVSTWRVFSTPLLRPLTVTPPSTIAGSPAVEAPGDAVASASARADGIRLASAAATASGRIFGATSEHERTCAISLLFNNELSLSCEDARTRHEHEVLLRLIDKAPPRSAAGRPSIDQATKTGEEEKASGAEPERLPATRAGRVSFPASCDAGDSAAVSASVHRVHCVHQRLVLSLTMYHSAPRRFQVSTFWALSFRSLEV